MYNSKKHDPLVNTESIGAWTSGGKMNGKIM